MFFRDCFLFSSPFYLPVCSLHLPLSSGVEGITVKNLIATSTSGVRIWDVRNRKREKGFLVKRVLGGICGGWGLGEMVMMVTV